MAIKKSELYSSLWASCDELRGGMDASQYKDYVLVLLFVKYVSDKYAGVPYAPIIIPDGASFKDMVALKGKPDIGDQINKKIIGPLANANKLSDMPDFNDPSKLGSGQEIVDRLTNLISIFENKALDFSKNRADGDDILGDAYEYLMRHFAAESGKSKGQFYTPAEVSRIMAQIIGIHEAITTNDTTVFVFFLEIELADSSYVTVRRGVEEATKICFKKHEAARQDFSELPKAGWDHVDLPFERAREMFDSLLDWRAISPWQYRKGLGYQLRSQDDYQDVFQLRRFSGKHADWKPYVAHIIGFDHKPIELHYEKQAQLEEKKVKAETVKTELGGSVDDTGKIEGLLLLKQKDAEKKQNLLDAFDFRQQDKERTKQVVDEIDTRIGALNSQRYSLNQTKKKIVAALEEDQILFNPEEAQRLFKEVGVLFSGQIKKDFDQLIAFNRAITEERRGYLQEERVEIEADLKRVGSDLNVLGNP